MGDLEFFLLLVVASLFVAVVVYVYLKFKGYIGNTQPSLGNFQQLEQNIPTAKKPGQQPKKMQALYRPKEIGHRTGQTRVFVTNKGLRKYEVNEFNFPMPNSRNLT
jgi:hypothetical protein